MSDLAMERYISEFDSFSFSQKVSLLDELRKKILPAGKKIKLARGIKKEQFLSDFLVGIVADTGQSADSIRKERLENYENPRRY